MHDSHVLHARLNGDDFNKDTKQGTWKKPDPETAAFFHEPRLATASRF